MKNEDLPPKYPERPMHKSKSEQENKIKPDYMVARDDEQSAQSFGETGEKSMRGLEYTYPPLSDDFKAEIAEINSLSVDKRMKEVSKRNFATRKVAKENGHILSNEEGIAFYDSDGTQYKISYKE